MRAICVHSKKEIKDFLFRDVFNNLYAIGDLDDSFWPYTIWYSLDTMQKQLPMPEKKIAQLALLYVGNELPILLGTTDDTLAMRKLLQSIIPLLPRRFYAHLNSGVAAVFAYDYNILFHGEYSKMALQYDYYRGVDTSEVIHLSIADTEEIGTFYQISYPENQFDPSQLETGQYYGIRYQGALVSVAGVHIYSQQYNIAIVGNVATHPNFRGRHLAETVCARLCKSLKMSVSNIGLHVRSNNASAIACYKRLGFENVAVYEEYGFDWK